MPTFTYIADNGAQLSVKPRVLESNFGDGYSQRVGDGINIRNRKWSLSFNSRTDAEIAPIISFLETQNGISSFDWLPPYGATGKWVCSEWQHQVVRFGINNVTAIFDEVFE